MLYGRKPGDGGSRGGSTGPDGPPAPEAAGRDGAGRPTPDAPEPDDPGTPLPTDPTPPDAPDAPEPDETPPDETPPDAPHPDDPGPLRPDDPDDPDGDGEDGGDGEPDPLSPRAEGLDRVFARRQGVSLGEDDATAAARPSSAAPPEMPPGRARFGSADIGSDSDPATADPPAGDPNGLGGSSSEAADSEGVSGGDSGEESAIFRPDLDTYSGPLELLLYLIHKDEVDIFDIPIARILDQFLEHTRRLEATGHLDLQGSGEYLVMAARLMEIKSRMLLPTETEDDEDLLEAEVEDPRWSLVKQLLEFREIKERAQLLEQAHRSRSQCFERIPLDLPPPEPGSLDLRESSTLDLRSAFQRVLDVLRERDSVRVVPGEEIPIETAMSGIRDQLVASPAHRRAFSELFPSDLGLRGLISYFLALLELTRLRHLHLEQPDDFGDIWVILREAA